MPYVDSLLTRKRLDPELSALLLYIHERTANERDDKKYFFRTFLATLYAAMCLRIAEIRGCAMRYADYQDLDGAFDCAWQELYRRWGEVLPLELHVVSDAELFGKDAAPILTEDVERLRMLINNLVHHFDAEPRVWGGELNYSISEVANLFANTDRATPQELLDIAFAISRKLYRDNVGTYEDKAIIKNGDTAGFLTFIKKYSAHRTQ